MQLREIPVGRKFEFEDKGTPLQWVGANGTKMLQAGRPLSECPDIGVHPSRGLFVYTGIVAGTCPQIQCLASGLRLVAVPGTYNRHVLLIF